MQKRAQDELARELASMLAWDIQHSSCNGSSIEIAALRSFQDLSHSDLCPINGKGHAPPVKRAPAVVDLQSQLILVGSGIPQGKNKHFKQRDLK